MRTLSEQSANQRFAVRRSGSPVTLGKVESNRQIFVALVQAAEKFVMGRRLEEACAVAEIVAYFASTNHTGIFRSVALENVLQDVGTRVVAKSPAAIVTNRLPMRVLHVLTEAHEIGGLTRAVRRWIELDESRRHSVLLTQQQDNPIPRWLSAAAVRTGGKFYVLDQQAQRTLKRAQQLWACAANYDLVILHTNSRDVVPMLAFGGGGSGPPLAKVDHADHLFWTDASICNSIWHLRRASFWVAEKRRGIEARRAKLIPIPLTPMERNVSRSEAKSRLGLSNDSILMLTIAAPYKYANECGTTLLALLSPLLQVNGKLEIIAIGPTNTSEWAEAGKKFGGRVKALGTRADTGLFYQAADIYVDSYPFASNTSLLEAGWYEVPLVSFSPYVGIECVLGPGSPGLDGALLEASDAERYRLVIQRLIDSDKLRERIGRRTRKRIALFHAGSSWFVFAREAYWHAMSTGRDDGRTAIGFPSGIEPVDADIYDLLHRAARIDLKVCMASALQTSRFLSRIRVVAAVWKATGILAVGLALPRLMDEILSRAWGYVRAVDLGRWRRGKGEGRKMRETGSPGAARRVRGLDAAKYK